MKAKIVCIVVGLLIGMFSGSLIGFIVADHRYDRGSEEFRICNMNLENHYNELQPQLREYLKARLYWLAITRVSKGYYPEHSHFDYGPLNEAVLGKIDCYKCADISNQEIYESAVKKHGALKATFSQ